MMTVPSLPAAHRQLEVRDSSAQPQMLRLKADIADNLTGDIHVEFVVKLPDVAFAVVFQCTEDSKDTRKMVISCLIIKGLRYLSIYSLLCNSLFLSISSSL